MALLSDNWEFPQAVEYLWTHQCSDWETYKLTKLSKWIENTSCSDNVIRSRQIHLHLSNLHITNTVINNTDKTMEWFRKSACDMFTNWLIDKESFSKEEAIALRLSSWKQNQIHETILSQIREEENQNVPAE